MLLAEVPSLCIFWPVALAAVETFARPRGLRSEMDSPDTFSGGGGRAGLFPGWGSEAGVCRAGRRHLRGSGCQEALTSPGRLAKG